MVSNPIHQAVILATRQLQDGSGQPLASVKTGGVRLLERTILTLKREGVRRFVVVYADESVREAFEDARSLAPLEIVWIHEPGADSAALAAAAPFVRGDFFLITCDRVFAPTVIRRLLEEPLDAVTLAASATDPVEGDVAAWPLALAQKSSVDAIGALVRRDDAPRARGVMTASRPLLLEAAASEDAVSLETLISRLSNEGQVRVAHLDQDAFVLSVHDEPTRKRAQDALLNALRKGVDGLIARHINRRFSLAATRVLQHFPVRPNHVTAFSLGVSLLASIAAAFATPGATWWLFVGAVLWQLASMLDGIDGEIARLKFAESKIGEWFDTLTDDIGKFTFFIGSGIGLSNVTGEPLWLQVCAVAVTIQVAVALYTYRKLAKTGSGSHYALAWEGGKPAKETWAARFYKKIEFMGRRDYYVFAWMCLAAVNLVNVAVVMMFMTTTIILVHEIVRPRQVREDFIVRPPVA